MEAPFKYGAPLLFRTPIWVVLPSDEDVLVELIPMSYRDVQHLIELQYIREFDDEVTSLQTIRTYITPYIRSLHRALNFPDFQTFVNQLSPQDLQYLYDKLIHISRLSQDQLSKLSSMLDVQFSPAFRDESWNCEVCKKKKLQYNRACGYLPENERDPKAILPRIKGRTFTQCPISQVDNFVLNQVGKAYNFLEKGVLPEAGGIGDQTEWFVQAASLYSRKISEAEAEMHQEQARKSK